MDDISPAYNPIQGFNFEEVEDTGSQEGSQLSQVSEESENEGEEGETRPPTPSDRSVLSQGGGNVTTMSKVTVGGEEIEYDATAASQGTQAIVLFKKEKREALAEEKRNDLFEKVTKTKLTKFDLVSMTLSEEDKLDDTYNLGVLVTKMKNHLHKYDCIDVFNIVELDKADPTKPTGDFIDLFSSYSIVAESSVAASNKWYQRYTKANYYRENLH